MSHSAVFYKLVGFAKGVTAEGEEFSRHAKKILAQVEEVKNYYKYHKTKTQRFSVSAPCSAYISIAFAEVLKQIDRTLPCEVFYTETNADEAVNNILQEGYGLELSAISGSLRAR